MNKYHQEILEEIKKVAKSNGRKTGGHDANKYMGTSHPIYNITNPQTKEIIKTWALKNKNISKDELILILDSAFKGESHNEKSLGGKILEYFSQLRQQIPPKHLDRWLTETEGWGEVDSLCQSSFTAKEMLDNWIQWEKLIRKFVSDPNVHKRRASLVLLCKAVRESDDPKLSNLAFENIEKLKKEKDILITKAISWLLRDLIKNHKGQVKDYIDNNSTSLPKIAVRETKRKLLTGKK